jgi:hypothetical protein
MKRLTRCVKRLTFIRLQVRNHSEKRHMDLERTDSEQDARQMSDVGSNTRRFVRLGGGSIRQAYIKKVLV